MISGVSSRLLAAAAIAGSCSLGVALVTIAWRDYQSQSLFLERAWPIRADIVALEPVGSDLNRSNPIAAFTTLQGVHLRVALPGLDLSPGDSVNLLYDEKSPETVRINDAWVLWFEPCAFGIAGALLATVPLLGLLGGGRKRLVRPL